MISKIKKILIISPDFNYSCGVSRYVYLLLKNLSKDESYKLYFITNGGDALDKLKNIGVTPFILKFSRGWKNVFYLLPNLNSLKEYCIKNDIDIIHTHHRYPEYLSYLISKNTKIKTITTVHSIVEGKNKFSFKSDRLVAVSKTVEKMLIENYNIPVNKIRTLYNSIEPLDSKFGVDKKGLLNELGIPSNTKIVLFLGRIAKIKGIDLLVEAFKTVQAQGNKLFLLIVGQIYDKRLKHVLNNLPFNTKLIPPVKDPYPFYSLADIIVLPSREDSFPYVMLESGLFKKPFIGANAGGIAEFIDDNVNGLLFEKGSVNQLAEKIIYMLNNPNEAKILGENLYLKVKKKISDDHYFQTIYNIYNELNN